MKDSCQLFENWIERQPRRDLSPAFEAHLQDCPSCRTRLARLQPVTEALLADETPAGLSPEFISALGCRMRREFLRHQSRRLGFRLFWIGLVCLPVVAAINIFWGSLIFNLVASLISPTLARIVLGMFIAGSVGISGLVYCTLPLLAGWKLAGNSTETPL